MKMRMIGVLAIALVFSSLGCIGGGHTAKDLAKIMPEGGRLIYVDLKALKEDKDLREIYSELRSTLIRAGIESEAGVDADDVNYVAGDGALIIGGKFNLEDLRDFLEDHDFDREEYKGVELWKRDYEAVAVSGNMLMLGNYDDLKRCIRVMRGEEGSMYGDRDVREVMDKLPDGIVMLVEKYGWWEGARAQEFALTKKDKDTLEIVGVVKFESEKAAEDARDDIKRSLKESAFYGVDVKQNGKLILFTARMDIEDWGEGFKEWFKVY